jgi:hypothetical protein
MLSNWIVVAVIIARGPAIRLVAKLSSVIGIWLSWFTSYGSRIPVTIGLVSVIE